MERSKTIHQHGKVDMLKAARSTVAGPVVCNACLPQRQNTGARKNTIKTKRHLDEFISERYSDLDTTFPIQKKSAREYVVNKLTEIEAYFNENIDIPENEYYSCFYRISI